MSRILIGMCSWTDETLIQCGKFYPEAVGCNDNQCKAALNRVVS